MPEKPQKDLFFDSAAKGAGERAAVRQRAETLWEHAETPRREAVAEALRDAPTRECFHHATAALNAGAPELAYEVYRVAIEHAWGFAETAGEHDPVERAWGHAGCAGCCEKLGWSELKEDHLLLGLHDLALGTQGHHPRHRDGRASRDIERDRYAAKICFVAVKLTGDGAIYEGFEEICEALQDFWAKRYRGYNAELELYNRIGKVSEWAKWMNHFDEPGQKTIFPESEAHGMPRRHLGPAGQTEDEVKRPPSDPRPQLELFDQTELAALNDWPTALESAEEPGPDDSDGPDVTE